MTITRRHVPLRLRRLGSGLAITIVAGLACAGPASAYRPDLNPAPIPLQAGANDIQGKLGVLHTQNFACPVGIDLVDASAPSPHSWWIRSKLIVVDSKPFQVGVQVHNTYWLGSKWYHLTFRCEGRLLEELPVAKFSWPLDV